MHVCGFPGSMRVAQGGSAGPVLFIQYFATPLRLTEYVNPLRPLIIVFSDMTTLNYNVIRVN